MTEPIRTHNGPARAMPGMSTWCLGLCVSVMFFVFYALTASRGAQWQDSGSHILRAVTGTLAHPLGLALVHPLHHWLSRFAVSLGLGEPCLAVTLISAVAAAAAVACVYGCVVRLTGSGTAGLLAAASLGLAHTFWQMATVAETYTLTTALLAAECWCLATYAATRRRTALFGMVLLNGLGVANHLLASLTTPVLLVVVLYALRRRQIRIGDVVVALGLWLLGSLPYSVLVVAEAIRSSDVIGTLRSALFGRSFAGEVLNTSLELRMLLVVAGFVIMNFPNLLLPAAFYGLSRRPRRGVPVPARAALVVGLVIHACFAVRYKIVDQHTFFLPLYVFLAIFAGVGFASVLRWPRVAARRAVLIAAVITLAATPVVYAFVPAVARRFDVLGSVMRDKPYRDDYVYVFTPWSVLERSADRMSRHAVKLAGERGLILVEDTMAEFAVRYRAFRNKRSEVTITHDITPGTILDAVNQGRPVVLVPARVTAPRTKAPIGFWARSEDLYVLDLASIE